MLRSEVAEPDEAVVTDEPQAAPAEPRSARTEAPTLPLGERLAWTRPVLAGGLFVGIIAVLTRMAAMPLSNTDTYFHLRFGSEFLHHWSLRHPGSVSTFATAPWLPTQWLPEVVMAKVAEWFGLAGVAWLSGLQCVALVTTLYLVSRRWVDPFVASLITLLAVLAASFDLSMRPQVLSFLMVVVTVAAWMRTREDRRLRWWLVPLTWVWAMVHGMWPVGIALGVVAVLGLALDRSRSRKDLGLALLVPALSAVAAALTPVGPGLYGAVLGVGSRSSYFAEWGSPDFGSLAGVSIGLMLAITVVLFVRRGRATWFDLLLLLTAGACAVWAWRTIPVAAMILVPLLARHAAPASDPVAAPRRSRPGRLELGLVAGAVALALGALAAAVPDAAADPPPQPSWVDPSLSALPQGTKVIGEWDWGGYLMWRYPQLDLLMHGYGDTFTVHQLQVNTHLVALDPGWDRELRQTGVTVGVMRPNSRLAYAMVHQLHWTVLHHSATIEELQAPPGW